MNPYAIIIIGLAIAALAFLVIHFHVIELVEAKAKAVEAQVRAEYDHVAAIVQNDLLKAEIALHIKKATLPVKALTPEQVEAYAALAAAEKAAAGPFPPETAGSSAAEVLKASAAAGLAAAQAEVAKANAAAQAS